MDGAGARRFFLASPPGRGRPELERDDLEHALRVLRLAAGDLLEGLDGRGRVWPLRVTARGKRTLELEEAGPVRFEPEPGAPGAALPWIELALSPPRGARAEELVERATQLGAAAVCWIVSARTPPRARELSAHRLERLRRIAAEATKQCRRLWLPELRGPVPLEELWGGALVLLDPSADAPPLWEVLGGLGEPFTRERPLTLLAGPEGGFEREEVAALDAAGARRARLAPHVLRIETAVEAALAVSVQWAISTGVASAGD